ncbi:MAG TPA: hypothetical protein VEC76_14160 [Streptosporangiaceae bacterium]|nr:hypothetical protein [Streptosporangiaceae bacterium]
MSFTDRLVLWLHIAFVIFTIGPVTLAIMSSPRAIRNRNVVVLRYQLLMTRIFGLGSLGVLVFGIILGQQQKDLGQAWLTVSLTLFVVALVLLVLIMRDQRRAVAALVLAGKQPAPAPQPAAGGNPEDGGAGTEEAASSAPPPAPAPAATTGAAAASHTASVERGRIASLGGVVSLIWLVILVLMVWNAG